MEERDCEELQVVELPKNMKGDDERACGGLEMGTNENGNECEKL